MVLICFFAEHDFGPLNNVVRGNIRVALYGLCNRIKQLVYSRCDKQCNAKAYREQCHGLPMLPNRQSCRRRHHHPPLDPLSCTLQTTRTCRSPNQPWHSRHGHSPGRHQYRAISLLGRCIWHAHSQRAGGRREIENQASRMALMVGMVLFPFHYFNWDPEFYMLFPISRRRKQPSLSSGTFTPSSPGFQSSFPPSRLPLTRGGLRSQEVQYQGPVSVLCHFRVPWPSKEFIVQKYFFYYFSHSEQECRECSAWLVFISA